MQSRNKVGYSLSSGAGSAVPFDAALFLPKPFRCRGGTGKDLSDIIFASFYKQN